MGSFLMQHTVCYVLMFFALLCGEYVSVLMIGVIACCENCGTVGVWSSYQACEETYTPLLLFCFLVGCVGGSVGRIVKYSEEKIKMI